MPLVVCFPTNLFQQTRGGDCHRVEYQLGGSDIDKSIRTATAALTIEILKHSLRDYIFENLQSNCQTLKLRTDQS